MGTVLLLAGSSSSMSAAASGLAGHDELQVALVPVARAPLVPTGILPAPVKVERRTASVGRLVGGGALVAGGLVVGGICLGNLSGAPGFCYSERTVELESGLQYERNRNLVYLLGFGTAAAGGLVILLPSKKETEAQEAAELAPAAESGGVTDAGEVAFGALKFRASEYQWHRVETVASFGGVCTLPGDQTWVLFPLHDEDVETPGPCTVMSPVVGAVLRSRSGPLETLKLGATVRVKGVVTTKRTMPGQTGQHSIEVEEIAPVNATPESSANE